MRDCRSLIVFAVACGFAVAAPALKDKPAETGSIVGEWERTGISNKGDQITVDTSKHRQTFSAEGNWGYKIGKKSFSPTGWSFSVDLKQSPPTIDIRTRGKDEGVDFGGIYKIEGDKLTICFVTGIDERPTTFEPSPKTPTTIWVFQRVRAKN